MSRERGRGKAARLLAEIARRKNTPAAIAAREEELRQFAQAREKRQEAAVRRLARAIVKQIPVDPDDGTAVVGFAPDGNFLWGAPMKAAERIARAVLAELDQPWWFHATEGLDEDPGDRADRLAHGFTGDDDWRNPRLFCRNGCGLTYGQVVEGKVRTCTAAGTVEEVEGGQTATA